MTRETPASLRSRLSSLSLRLQAMDSASPSTTQTCSFSSPAPELRQHTRSFVLADFEGRPARENTVCNDCVERLLARECIQVSASSRDECKLCAVAALKPEAYTKPFCDFLTENPTVFHAVDYFKTKLVALGYVELPAREDWTGRIKAGGKYWVTRNGSSIIAFTVGKKYVPGNGVAMIAGHVDALTARVKPVSTRPNRAGYVQLGVAPYAGAFNPTWWDRDLSIGGRVVVKDEATGKISTRLVKIGWPSMPTVATLNSTIANLH